MPCQPSPFDSVLSSPQTGSGAAFRLRSETAALLVGDLRHLHDPLDPLDLGHFDRLLHVADLHFGNLLAGASENRPRGARVEILHGALGVCGCDGVLAWNLQQEKPLEPSDPSESRSGPWKEPGYQLLLWHLHQKH